MFKEFFSWMLSPFAAKTDHLIIENDDIPFVVKFNKNNSAIEVSIKDYLVLTAGEQYQMEKLAYSIEHNMNKRIESFVFFTPRSNAKDKYISTVIENELLIPIYETFKCTGFKSVVGRHRYNLIAKGILK